VYIGGILGRGTCRGYREYRWMQVGLTTLKGGSTISANAQSLHGAASAENIRLRGQPSLNRLSYYITYLLGLK